MKNNIFFTLILTIITVFPLWAQNILPAQYDIIKRNKSDIITATIEVDLNKKQDNPRWIPDRTTLTILTEKLTRPIITKNKAAELQPQNAPPSPTENEPYKGIILRLKTVHGELIDAIRIYNGYVTAPNGTPLTLDPKREFEYWLFSTSENNVGQKIAVQVLPILTFEQCKLIGSLTIDTRPSQCLLPDNRILLDVPFSELSADDLKATDFDSCLEYGESLIATFPRRCMAKGGRVFTEPVRLPAHEAYLHELSPTETISPTLNK